MSNLIVIAYPSLEQAEDVRNKLFSFQKEYLIQMGDAVIAEKKHDGHIKLHQIFSTTAAGAATGSLWGLLIGVIFMVPLAGVAVGAASGALAGALSDFGINDKFMKDVADSLQPGNAALFVLINKITMDKVLAGLEGTGGVIMQTSLDHSKEEDLRKALADHISENPK
ncbi:MULTISPECIES: DUF1269 domain-containing protein [Pseudovibrio]|uniref:DUF1269 domain-containing protein n=1 Tax=Stappiaceae TaxID=2821832 RepID=UPI002367232F|nr:MULTISPECIES: DUF1269 domain-containing protein [Pseudovibrio]MDD7911057.1 DUF1269 domain-containing protein [Pseudovibrio exalbescens]MDX5593220.1 DUF1269 domain-containing protein [Pseudovibrio sp. SPO723]